MALYSHATKDLIEADLAEGQFFDASIINSDLDSLCCNNAKLSKIDIKDSNCNNSVFNNADFANCNFDHSNLSAHSLINAICRILPLPAQVL